MVMSQPAETQDNQQFELPIMAGPWKETWVGYGMGFSILMRLAALFEREPSQPSLLLSQSLE